MFSTFHMGHYIPVTWLTLGADYLVWGMDPTGYHLTSLLFHAATALAFFAVAHRLLARGLPGTPRDHIALGAAAAALFFAVHPLRVESVAWVTARRDVVSGLFFMLALLAWLRSIEGARRRCWYLGSLGLFAGALLSKALTLGLPVVLLVLDVYPLRRLGGGRGWRVRSVWLEKVPYLLMAAAAAVVAIAATPASARASLEAMSLEARALVAVHGLTFYIVKTVGSVMIAAALVVAMRRRWPALAGAAVVYVTLLFPTLGFFATGPQAVADRYSYLPCLGWALVVGGVVARRWAGRRYVPVVAGAVLATLLVLTAQQVRVWRSSVTLWGHAVALEPANRFARINLGAAYAAEGRTAEAIVQYREVLRISRDKAPWYEVLGWLYASRGQIAEALPLLVEALRLEPGRPGACDNARKAVRELAVPTPPEVSACPAAPSGPSK
jgi:hypothetical protein